ncbi:MAG TPA: PEP-CTERM system TPR-repeat protein PrsT [Chromatiaceae bacterium]|jgi:putative PEP-CTERM system TPR-repeat lipoprotein|nr:PEP-CTERM system TPR-repeat protein PrsT [Chromatiaceae bacterium]HCS90577.1 PEP-CTERM system TPR-repeat protein PrsT [Chromatiaceae bacterium]
MLHPALQPWLRSLKQCIVILCLLMAIPVTASEIDTANDEWASGNAKSAVIRLKSLLQSDPDNAAARLLLGRIYLESGDAVAAEQEIARARSNGAAESDALPPLLEALIAQRQISRALELSETNFEMQPKFLSEVLALRGIALLNDDPLAANEAFRQAREANPQAIKPLLGLATFALRENDQEGARALIQQVIEIAPEQPDGWRALGELEYRIGNYSEAVAAYDKALEYARSTWQLHQQRAFALLETENPTRAWQDVTALRESMPQFPGRFYVMGRLTLLDNQFEEAINHFEYYLRFIPKDPRAIYFAALTLHRLGRNAQAEEYLIRLQALQPNNPSAAILLAKVRLENADPIGAEELLAPLANRPNASLVTLELMRQALVKQDRAEEATALIERAARQYPDAPSAQIAYARSLQQQGKPGEALPLLRAAVEQLPDNEEAPMSLIRAELSAGNLDEARAAAEAFVKRAPDSPAALTGHAAVLNQQGDTEGARAALKQAIEIDPDYIRATLALAALEISEQRNDAAREVLNSLLARKPGTTSAVLILAAIQQREDGVAAFGDQIRAGLEAAPGNLQLRLILGRFYLAQRESDKALQLALDAPAVQAKEPSLLTFKAQAELSAGRPEQASLTLAQLAEIAPESAQICYMQATATAIAGDARATQVHLNDGLSMDQRQELQAGRLSRILGELSDRGEREQLIASLIKTAPNHQAVIYVKARQALQQRDFDQAITDLRRLHREYPDTELYLISLAEVLDAAGSTQQAITTLQKWIETHPEVTRSRLLMAQMQLGNDNTSAASEQYRAVIANEPNNALALNNLAMLTIEESPQKAREYAERALALRPENPLFIDTMGSVLIELGEIDQARDLLAKAHAGTTNPSIAFRYAKTLASTGDQKSARRVLLQIQAQNFPEKAEAEALYLELANNR